MARRKRKDQQPEEIKGDAYEPPSDPPDALAGPWDKAAAPSTPETPAQPADEGQPEPPRKTATQRAAEKPRAVMTRSFPGRKVELIDDGNAGGVGIKLTYDDPAERPSDAVSRRAPSPPQEPTISWPSV
jgi:hypothetical protein